MRRFLPTLKLFFNLSFQILITILQIVQEVQKGKTLQFPLTPTHTTPLTQATRIQQKSPFRSRKGFPFSSLLNLEAEDLRTIVQQDRSPALGARRNRIVKLGKLQ